MKSFLFFLLSIALLLCCSLDLDLDCSRSLNHMGLLLQPVSAAVLFPIYPTNGYRRPSISSVDASVNPTLARVESPASLAGLLVFSPAPFTGPMFVNNSCTGAPGEDCRVRYRILQPNAVDGIYGCSFTTTTTSGGETIGADTMLLLQRAGGCFFGTKAQNAQKIGAGAVMHTGCDPAPPFNCAPGLTITYSRLNISIPSPYMAYADAFRLRTYLNGRDAWLAAQALSSSSTASASASYSSSSSTGPSSMFSSSSTGPFGNFSGMSSSSTGASGPQCPVCNCSDPSSGGSSTPSGPSTPVFTDFSQPLIISFAATGPLVAEEATALRTIVRNMLAAPGGKVDDNTLTQNNANGWTSLRGFQDLLANPQLDPCLYRVVGLYCENSHLTGVWLLGVGGPLFNGPFDPAWGSFPKLRALELGNQNFQGPLPEAICNLTSLWVLGMDRQGDGVRVDVPQGITYVPNCLGSMGLLYFSASTNLISNFPTQFNSVNGSIRMITLDHNRISSSLPLNFSSTLMSLVTLDLSFNPTMGNVDVSKISFKGWTNLTTLSLAHSSLTGTFNNTAFDNCPQLTLLDLSYNNLAGPLPTLANTVLLQAITMNNNQFRGGLPDSWQLLTSVTTVRLQYNLLSSPMGVLSQMLRVQSIWLNNNKLITDNSINDAGVLISSMTPNNVVEMLLDYNNITGTWQSGLLSNTKSFQTLSVSHNQLSALPQDMWTIPIARWDVSFNNLTGAFPLNYPFNNTYINLQGNPALQLWPLPSWLVQTEDFTSARADSKFVCRILSVTNLKNLQFLVDPEFTLYQGCDCVRGLFGFAPYCDAIPERAAVSPTKGFTSDEVGPDYAHMIATGPGYSSGSNSLSSNDMMATSPTLLQANLQANASAFTVLSPQGFSDSFYDSSSSSQRLTLGITTTWFVNLQSLFMDMALPAQWNETESSVRTVGVAPTPYGFLPKTEGTAAASDPGRYIVEFPVTNENGTTTSDKNSFFIGDQDRFQPVRMITLQLWISKALFTQPSDVLFVYEGDPSLSGARIASYIGTDKFPDLPDANTSNSIVFTPEYQQRYGDQIAAIVDPTLIEVMVTGNAASIHFASRAVNGKHFFATYTYGFSCEVYATAEDRDARLSKYYLASGDSGFRCAAVLPTYLMDPSIRYAVYALGALCFAWATVHFIAILWYWNAPLYRAASRPFMLLILLMLGAMSLGSMLYAAVPAIENDTSSARHKARAICIGRAWLTCLPLSSILAILYAKSNRIDNIFGSMTLLIAKNVSDLSIVKTIVSICSLELILLFVFSFMPLSKPLLAPGSGNLSTYNINQCSMEDGAYIWLGVQIAFFALLMIACAILSFKTRNLPSAFNESAHITNCILVLIFFCLILIPLDFYAHKQPESAVLLQGLGQAFLVAMITSIIFAPKLYIVLTADAASQKAMMSGSNVNVGGGAGGAVVVNPNQDSFATTTPSPANNRPTGVRQPLPKTNLRVSNAMPTTSSTQGMSSFAPSVSSSNQAHHVPMYQRSDVIDEGSESMAHSFATDASSSFGIGARELNESGVELMNRGTLRSDQGSSSSTPPRSPRASDSSSNAPSIPAADSALWRAKSRMSLMLAPLSPIGNKPVSTQQVHRDSDAPPPPPMQ